jgi:hypothetical protein
MSNDVNDKLITIRVSEDLVNKVILKMKWTPNLPATYAVDQALRELLER